MSSFPMPHQIPPTAQQVTGALRSVITASQQLIETNPSTINDLRPIFLQFYANPIFTIVLGLPTQHQPTPPMPEHQLSSQLDDIVSMLKALSQTVDGLKNNPGGKTPTPNTPPSASKAAKPGLTKQATTYSAKLGTPSRPSLVLDFPAGTFQQSTRVPEASLCLCINEALATNNQYLAWLSAIKWTAKGNLLDVNITISCIRPNVKWSKILIHSVPTGVSKERAAYSKEECHMALAKENPTYASLNIMQPPRWICPHSSFTPSQAYSSLIVAFEDPNGSKNKELLTSKQLYVFGMHTKTAKWKQSSPKLTTQTTNAVKPASELPPPMAAGNEDPMLQDPASWVPPFPNQRKCPTSPTSPTPAQPSSSSKGKKKRRM
ncbi:hypothetical protein BJV74DRAFT_917148 [Russula compacta]|nr:hypothetical protein BJV74DRAFT_917148 [Russula compacta]